jgi:serine/threonine protein kinase/Tfp pilus assembly protein PilF
MSSAPDASTLAIDLRARLGTQWRAAEPPAVAQLRDVLLGLPPDSPEGGARVLAQLVAEHLECSWDEGRGNELEEYMGEFGGDFVEFASLDTIPAELVEAEFLVRHMRRHADHPYLSEYEARFPGREDVFERLRGHCRDGERYVLVRLLPPGGLGRVWVAYDRNLQRFVALKEPRPDTRDDPETLARLAAEARITAQLDHQAIVPVYEVKQHGEAFYVMRLVPGRRLDEVIADYHHLPGVEERRRRVLWDQLLRAFITVCDAVAYAHSRDVVHRDLKPHNVVQGEFGQTVVLDWGLAVRVTPSAGQDRIRPRAPVGALPAPPTRPGSASVTVACSTIGSHQIRGTPAYMAPEQADGHSDPRSDIFGLGAILYHILTGQAPFAGHHEPLEERLAQVRAARYRRPREVQPRVPRALEAVCLRALAPDPALRYASARDLGLEVNRYLADERVDAYPERRLERLRRLVRRHRRLTTAVVLALLTCVALAGAWVVRTADIRAAAASDVYLQEGERHLARRQWSLARDYFDRALQLTTDSPGASCGRARAFEGLGQHERAQKDFDRAVGVGPQEVLTWFVRGTYHARRRNFERAEADFAQALRLDPGHALTYLNRAQLCREKSRWAQAEADYTEAIRHDPGRAMAYGGRALVREGERRYALALEDHDRALRLAPGSPELWFNRGLFLLRLGRREEGSRDLNEAIRLQPEFAGREVSPPAQFFYSAREASD